MNGINTGISDMHFDNSNACNDYYNLQGIKVEKPGRGMFYKNYKKIIVTNVFKRLVRLYLYEIQN